jgi:hypothetical protein
MFDNYSFIIRIWGKWLLGPASGAPCQKERDVEASELLGSRKASLLNSMSGEIPHQAGFFSPAL